MSSLLEAPDAMHHAEGQTFPHTQDICSANPQC